MMYDVIIVGAGAAGLFCAAHITDKTKKVLVLEGTEKTGLKLLISGSGQCNFTHGGDIEDFIEMYGTKGRRIRKILMGYTNKDVIEYFQKAGLKVTEREDGKVFPASLKASGVLEILTDKIKANGTKIRTSSKVSDFYREDEGWTVVISSGEKLRCRNLVLASGGLTFPKTGSDGSVFPLVEKLGDVKVNRPVPALTPLFVEDYIFTDISGVSVKGCRIEKVQEGVKNKDRVPSYTDDILFTHRNLSGPLCLNYSRYLDNGDRFTVDFLPEGFKSGEHLPYRGCRKNIMTLVHDETGLARGLTEILVKKALEITGQPEKIITGKSASLPGGFVKVLEGLIREYPFTLSGKGGPAVAMVTAGGVDLSEISPSTMESKKHPGLHFAGEILDVDGNTGGYNIQFAFSSGYTAARHILQLP